MVEIHVQYNNLFENDFLFNKVYKQVQRNNDFIRCINKIRLYSNDLYIHSMNVAKISMLIAEGINLNYENLFIAAALHDYGKLYISKSILDSPNKLSEYERRKIQLHAAIGHVYLSEVTEFSDEILKAVMEHHERLDGSGYYKMKNRSISQFAKIIAIADVYDAMSTDRVYRASIQKDEIIDYFEKNEGLLFHRKYTKKLIQIIRERY